MTAFEFALIMSGTCSAFPGSDRRYRDACKVAAKAFMTEAWAQHDQGNVTERDMLLAIATKVKASQRPLKRHTDCVQREIGTVLASVTSEP